MTMTSTVGRSGTRVLLPVIARCGTGHSSGLGVHRWVVEQAVALLHWFRRLRIRWEIRDDIHEAFLSLACAIICWRRLRTSRFVRTSKARRRHGGLAARGPQQAGKFRQANRSR